MVLAELCAYVKQPEQLRQELDEWGIDLLDVPAIAAPICGAAYARYAAARKAGSQKEAPRTPLPDFFIGAHAEVLGLTVIPNDAGRLKTYFPSVKLETP